MTQSNQTILTSYRATSQTEREKGTYFEELTRTYYHYEASYTDLYSDVWLFADWAREVGTPLFGSRMNWLAMPMKISGRRAQTKPCPLFAGVWSDSRSLFVGHVYP